MGDADEAWETFKGSVPPEVYPTYQDTFKAGYLAALENAADDAEAHTTHGTHVHTFWAAGRWLRARVEEIRNG